MPIRLGHASTSVRSDYHLLVEPMYFSLSTDDPVQYARPSIDVLFESAAPMSSAPETIGIVLTGANHDGAQGAAEDPARGGIVVVAGSRDGGMSGDARRRRWRLVPDALVRSRRAHRAWSRLGELIPLGFPNSWP